MSTTARRWGRAAAIAACSFVFVLPLTFMILGSLRMPGLPPPDGFEVLPDPLRWANYATVSFFVPVTLLARNSFLVVAAAVPVTVVIASWAGFAVATGSARVRRVVIGASVIALMVPATALWVPRFAVLRWLGVTDTLFSLMTPALMATSPLFVLLFAFAYSRIPTQLYEAAAVEGLSPLRIWWQVAWPLGRAAAFAVAVLAFAFHWSNFIDALLYISAPELETVPLGLRQLQTLEPTNHPILLAAAVMSTAPPLLAFLLGQRALFVRTLAP